MEGLERVDNKKFLQELKSRIKENKISEEEIFQVLEPQKVEIISHYKKIDFKKLTEEDWKKACQVLEKDKVYQEEVELWDNIDD